MTTVDELMNQTPLTAEQLASMAGVVRNAVETTMRRGMMVVGAEPQTLKLLATALHLQAENDRFRARGEHFHRGTSSDFEEVLIYAAIVAHQDAGGATIPNIEEGGVRIAMQVTGVEVSARHFLVAVKRHFDKLYDEHMVVVRKEAALLLKGRVQRLVVGLQKMEGALRQQLAADFPEVNDLFEEE